MHSVNYQRGRDPLSIETIRSVLVRLEDTIIFGLIERAQFAHNPRMYQGGVFPELKDLDFKGSWLDWFLQETETFHAKARRYTSPDEYPFTTNLPEPILKPLSFPKILYANNINYNASILNFYTKSVIPRMTRYATLDLAAKKRATGIRGEGEFEDDGNYGSAATIDVEILQGISKRVHYGKFVSESKFQSKPADFIPHILNPNPQALLDLISKPEVETKLLGRVRSKAETYTQDITGGPAKCAQLDVDGVVELYENYIIPLTKDVEVAYLLHRLDNLSQEEIEALKTPKVQ